MRCFKLYCYVFYFLNNIFVIDCFGQNPDGPALKRQAELANENIEKISLLLSICGYYEAHDLDSAISYAHQAYELSKKLDYTKGEAVCLKNLGQLFMKKDNYFFGLQTEINALKIFEKLEDDIGMAETYYAMGDIYERVSDHQQALNSFYRSLRKTDIFQDSTLIMNIYSSLGYNYYKLGNQDSAARYTQLAYDLARTRKNNAERLPWTIALMGVVQQEMGNPAIAMAYYYDAIQKAHQFNQVGLLPYVYQVMAELYKATTLTDSAILYGEKALVASQRINFSKGVAEASEFLANIYSDHDKGKAVDYFKLSGQLRDSIFSIQKINQVQNIAYNEEFRQIELEKEKLNEAKERKYNIQYSAITIGIIVFVLLFFLLSHSIMVNARIVSFLGVLALLVVFEFINLILHPYLARVTNHSPPLMLGVLVLVAALLVPAHHYLQKWVNTKLIQKNNRIRLHAARKIIAELEKPPH